MYDFKVLHFYASLSFSWRIFQFLIVKNICRPKLIQQKALWPWAITCWFIMWTIQALESLWFKDKWPSTFNSIALLNFFSSGYLFYYFDPPLSKLEIYDNSLWFNQSPVLHANVKIIVFSSPGPKVHGNYCHHLASGICCLSSVTFSHFKLLLWNHWANWNQT